MHALSKWLFDIMLKCNYEGFRFLSNLSAIPGPWACHTAAAWWRTLLWSSLACCAGNHTLLYQPLWSHGSRTAAIHIGRAKQKYGHVIQKWHCVHFGEDNIYTCMDLWDSIIMTSLTFSHRIKSGLIFFFFCPRSFMSPAHNIKLQEEKFRASVFL